MSRDGKNMIPGLAGGLPPGHVGTTGSVGEERSRESEIGVAAGKVWQALNGKGSMVKTQVAKATGLSNDMVSLGIGWLAREGKLDFQKTPKGDLVKLKG